MNSGTLYIVATPIGNLEDITLRALRILREVDYIAAEDTRHSKLLLKQYEINTKLLAYHNFNEESCSKKILDLLLNGKHIALISDAGTPLINDPGYRLINLARTENINIVPIPGPSAITAAISVAGLPTNQFLFYGFLPAKLKERQSVLMTLKNHPATLIFYEAPHRILEMAQDCLEVFGEERKMVIAKELTKQFETIKHDQIGKIIEWLQEDPMRQKGEFVVLVEGAVAQISDEVSTSKILAVLTEELPPSKAAMIVAKLTGANKSDLYNQILKAKPQKQT
jgi:16S rRNA (cytidine1402-2'-O)-methyltransferase